MVWSLDRGVIFVLGAMSRAGNRQFVRKGRCRGVILGSSSSFQSVNLHLWVQGYGFGMMFEDP